MGNLKKGYNYHIVIYLNQFLLLTKTPNNITAHNYQNNRSLYNSALVALITSVVCQKIAIASINGGRCTHL